MLDRRPGEPGMTHVEIAKMAHLDQKHWWYCGLRDMIRRTVSGRLQKVQPRILDAGCGTGETLHSLRLLLSPSYIGGFDASPLAVELSRTRVRGGDIYLGDVRDPEIHENRLDLVLSCDVITIPGIEECRDGLERMVGALRPGGLLILNLPAFNWLYSEHDQAVGTQQRICADDARRLLLSLHLDVELVTYRVFSLFPVVLAARLPSMLRSGSIEYPESDLHPVHPHMNDLLAKMLYAENIAVTEGLNLPWGTSVFAVGRKP